MYSRIVKTWLAAILLILPFQMTISSYISKWNSTLSNIVNNLDELTAVVFLLLSIREYYKNRQLSNKLFFFYLSP